MNFPPSPEAMLQNTQHLGILNKLLSFELERSKQLCYPSSIRIAPRTGMGPFEAALRSGQVPVIAEFKRASPSLGPFATGVDVREKLESYKLGGAAAFSILAEPAFFQGRPEDFSVAGALGVPILYKGFVCTLAHLDEASALGAQAVLLIARLLQEHLPAFVACAIERGLEPLVELHDLSEIPQVEAAHPRMVGWNARDLSDFSVRAPDAAPLREALPGALIVRESGLGTPADARLALANGFDALLIGETLMRHEDPRAFLADIGWPAL
jgi:indole-3-glycerol phosphate synthase